MLSHSDPMMTKIEKFVIIDSLQALVIGYYTLRGKKPKEKENSDKNKSYLFA